MKFRPLHDRVVVRRVDSEEKTAGGIIIPDTAKEKPSEGEVVAVGAGARGGETMHSSLWMLKLATKSYSANGLALKSGLTATTC